MISSGNLQDPNPYCFIFVGSYLFIYLFIHLFTIAFLSVKIYWLNQSFPHDFHNITLKVSSTIPTPNNNQNVFYKNKKYYQKVKKTKKKNH